MSHLLDQRHAHVVSEEPRVVVYLNVRKGALSGQDIPGQIHCTAPSGNILRAQISYHNDDSDFSTDHAPTWWLNMGTSSVGPAIKFDSRDTFEPIDYFNIKEVEILLKGMQLVSAYVDKLVDDMKEARESEQPT